MTGIEIQRELLNTPKQGSTLLKIVHICRAFDFTLKTHAKNDSSLDYIEFGDSNLWLHHKTGYYTGVRIKTGELGMVWGMIFTNFFDGTITGNQNPTDVEQFTHNLESAMRYMEDNAVFHMGGHRKPIPRNLLPKIKEIIEQEDFEIPEDMKGLAFTMKAEDFPEYEIPEVEA